MLPPLFELYILINIKISFAFKLHVVSFFTRLKRTLRTYFPKHGIGNLKIDLDCYIINFKFVNRIKLTNGTECM